MYNKQQYHAKFLSTRSQANKQRKNTNVRFYPIKKQDRLDSTTAKMDNLKKSNMFDFNMQNSEKLNVSFTK